MQNQTVSPIVVIASVGGILALIGVFLPWLSGDFSGQNASGTNASLFNGNVIILLSIISLVSLGAIYVVKDRVTILGATILAAAIGVITVFLAIGNFSDITTAVSQSGGDISPGIGIYVVLIGAIVLAAFSGLYVLQSIQESQSASQP